MGQMVRLAPKIILHSPVSDEALLDDFVEQCLRDNVQLVATMGPGCSRLQDIIIEIVDGHPKGFLVTSSYPDKRFEDVLKLVAREMGPADPVQEMRL